MKILLWISTRHVFRVCGAAMLLLAVALAAGTRTPGATTHPSTDAAVAGATGLQHGVIWYGPAPREEIRRVAAQRYSVGITGKNELSDSDKPIIRSHNPNFRWFVYNSLTDNYVVPHPSPAAEHDLLQSLARQRGWDPEEAYLHYYDDTWFVLDRDTLFVPGFGGGSASSLSQSRIATYFVDLSRRLTNFSTRRAAQLHKEAMIQLAFETPFTNSTLYPDGIFLDNSAFILFNSGTVLSGGHVRETPGRLRIGSADFQRWHWNTNIGPFMTALKDSLQSSASWSRDGRRKELMVNVSNVWDDSYVTRDIGDILFLEYQYSPLRAVGPGAVDEAHRRDVLAANAGITSFYSAVVWENVTPFEGSFTYAQAQLSNLAWYLIARTTNTILFEMWTSLPGQAGWDSLTWRPCIDVANDRLGAVRGEPYTLAEGTDPVGYRYVVKARNYANGVAVVRQRGDWNQNVGPQTAVRVPLPQPYLPVDPAGNLGGPVQSITLRNGEGVFLLSSGVPSLYSLTVTTAGSGIVRRQPYRDAYTPGTIVTLWPLPNPGWRFARWQGDVTGVGNPFRIQMNSGRNISAVFTLNAAPVAANDAYRTSIGTLLQIPAPGILTNDTDTNGDPLRASVLTGPSRGLVVLYPDESLAYVPNAGFSGVDQFTYKVEDNYAGASTGTVSLQVAGAPSSGVSFGATRSGASSGSAVVATSTALDFEPGGLYLAAISSKPYRAVTGVVGMNLAWTRVRAQCSGRNQTGVEIWMAQGSASAGVVSASFRSAPTNAVIVASRYAGADAIDPIGSIVSGNTNGAEGTCSGGVDGPSYNLPLAAGTNGVVFGAAAMRNKAHTPGSGYVERAEVRQGSGGDQVSLAVMDRAVSGTAQVSGGLGSGTDWAMAAIEIRPSAQSASKQEAEPAAVPPNLSLRVFPNPARNSATIAYDLPQAARVRVRIHDAAGRRIATLTGPEATGSHRLVWDGRDTAGNQVPAGVYFVEADIGSRRWTRKLVLQR